MKKSELAYLLKTIRKAASVLRLFFVLTAAHAVYAVVVFIMGDATFLETLPSVLNAVVFGAVHGFIASACDLHAHATYETEEDAPEAQNP